MEESAWIANRRLIVIGEQIILPCNLFCKEHRGVFDSAIAMERHIVECCKAYYFHLHNIGLIKKKLAQDSTKTAIDQGVCDFAIRQQRPVFPQCGLLSYQLSAGRVSKGAELSCSSCLWLFSAKSHNSSSGEATLVAHPTACHIQAVFSCV